MSLGSRRLHSAEPPLRRNRISSCDLREARNISALGKEVRVAEEKQNLLQLYRFCFLMLADAAEAQ